MNRFLSFLRWILMGVALTDPEERKTLRRQWTRSIWLFVSLAALAWMIEIVRCLLR